MNLFARSQSAARLLVFLVVALFTSLLLASEAPAGFGPVTAAPTNPNDLPQVTAEPPLRVPATASCTETVLVHTFANSYYSPGYGHHAASACPGPWSFVSLSAVVSTSGVQFDRLFDIYIGHVPLLSSSTSEPASELPSAITHWEVDSDVSRYAKLLASDQPITAVLNNVNDTTYTGQYAVTLKLTYYNIGAGAPAIVAPDYVGAVFDPGTTPYQDGPGDYGTSGYAGLGTSNTTYTKTLTVPRNLLKLTAEVYAEGHGACEEFWWAEPGQCGVGTPLRQAVLSIDGVVAGFAPVYPVLFTGGGGPGSWEPIPSPRAWHLDPYRLDLTPFIGQLGDGKPHSFKIDIPDAAYSDPGDYWVVGATLLGSTDPGATQTTGALTSAPVAAAATTSTTADPTNTATADFSGSRDASWAGYVVGSTGRVSTVVTNHLDIDTKSAALVDSTWHWNTSSAVTAGTAAAVTTAATHTYTLSSAGTGPGTFGDAGTTSIDGPTPYNSTFSLQLVTAGAVEANVTEAETYNGSDSTGFCYQRAINTSAGYVVSDQTTPICVAGTATTSGGTSSSGAAGDRCTVPGLTLGTDAVGDETTMQSSQDIVSISAAEPYVAGGNPLIAFHIKVTDLKTLVPGSAYYTSFITGDGATIYGVRMVVPVTGSPTFISYVASPSGGTTPVTDGRFVGTSTAAESGSNYVASSGDITIYVKPANIGLTAVNQVLTGFNGGVIQNANPTGAGVNAAEVVDGLPDDLDRNNGNSFTYDANSVCAPNNPPVANLTVDKTKGDKPLTVNFSGTGSTDPDTASTGDKVASYAFTFGDGTMATNTTGTAAHTYSKSGTFTPTLTVTDTHGAASPTVTGSAITSVNEAPTVTLAASPAAPTPGQAVTFTATGADANAGDASTLMYSFRHGRRRHLRGALRLGEHPAEDLLRRRYLHRQRYGRGPGRRYRHRHHQGHRRQRGDAERVHLRQPHRRRPEHLYHLGNGNHGRWQRPVRDQHFGRQLGAVQHQRRRLHLGQRDDQGRRHARRAPHFVQQRQHQRDHLGDGRWLLHDLRVDHRLGRPRAGRLRLHRAGQRGSGRGDHFQYRDAGQLRQRAGGAGPVRLLQHQRRGVQHGEWHHHQGPDPAGADDQQHQIAGLREVVHQRRRRQGLFHGADAEVDKPGCHSPATGGGWSGGRRRRS